MARRKQEEAPAPGAPAWMATYGDLMTLLLCFFVLLFSMSTVDDIKYNQVAESFAQTFSIFSAGATSIGDGVLISNGVSQLNELDKYINSMGQSEQDDNLAEEDTVAQLIQEEKLIESEKLAEKIEENVKEENLEKEIDISFTSEYVYLTLNGAFMFESGSADIREEAIEMLAKVGIILENYADSIVEIEGHSDNIPISSATFPNNNYLSSARAISVFEFFIERTTLSPAMIKHAGRGEYNPISDNTSPEGRARNRRVEIKIYHELSTYQ